MDAETQKIIADQMKQLPKDVIEAIISVDYKTKLQEITKHQRLLIDQAAKMEMETTLVMIGLEPLADYIGNLQRELAIPEARAKEIAVDISESIFKPIRDSLKVMNELGEDSDIPAEDKNTEADKEELITKFTNSNEVNLNRDQILDEIENPSMMKQSVNALNKTPAVASAPVIPALEVIPPATLVKTTELEIRPTQEIQLNQGSTIQTETVSNQKVGEVKKEIPEAIAPNTTNSMDFLKNKMTANVVAPRQIINAKPEIKLPEIEKKRPSSGVDPYREPLM